MKLINYTQTFEENNRLWLVNFLWFRAYYTYCAELKISNIEKCYLQGAVDETLAYKSTYFLYKFIICKSKICD